MSIINKLAGQNQTTARVVDGKLILSLPQAVKPVVWQMELGQAKASALEIQDGKSDLYALCLKTPKGETVEIASFENRNHAVKSLMKIAKALQEARGEISNTGVTASPQSGKKSGIVSILLALGLLFALFVVWSAVANMPTDMQNMPTSAGEPTTADQSGVPLSADEFLKGR